MTHDFNEETLLPFGSIESSADSSAPARKRAAKKTATKVAAKKTAAKKVAKKKVASEDAPAPAPVPAPAPAPVAVDAPVAPKKKAATKRASKTAVAKEAAPFAPAAAGPVKAAEPKPAPASPPSPAPEPRAEAPAPSSDSPVPAGEDAGQRKFGRVPGGGRIQREPREQREPQEAREPREQREPQEAREPREQREPQEPREPREPRGENQPPREPREPREGQPQPQFREGNPNGNPGQSGGQDGRESRSKRRRDKRKRRRDRDRDGGEGQGNPQGQRPPHEQGPRPQHQHPQGERRPQRDQVENRPPPQPQFTGPKTEVDGMLELAPKGFGFLRVPAKRFDQARDDVFVPPETVRRYGLRVGHWIHGIAQEGPRGPQLIEINSINGLTPGESRKLPLFEELKAINPTKRISFETTPDRYTTRVVDIMAPVGRGQRGLIVSPPRSGKTTLMLHMAEAVREKYEESLHLMIVLVDERPEEVTEFRRALPGVEIYASSNDDGARSHCRIAELAIERAKRLVEAGKDVFLLMDSITRLARAYNHGMGGQRGRGIASGGLTVGALETPRRLFAAARNTRGGGSLTILATALIQTNSKADEAIFQEFKGTGNMELVLDRKIAENYIYPAVDIFKSGTRREELLLAEHSLHKIHLIRRGLSGHRPVEAMERLLFFLKKFPNNPQMLMEIKG